MSDSNAAKSNASSKLVQKQSHSGGQDQPGRLNGGNSADKAGAEEKHGQKKAMRILPINEAK